MPYIDREKAQIFLRTYCLAKYPTSFASGLLTAADQLNKIPTADVAEVVRCKNCRLRGTDRCPMYYEEVIGYEDEYGTVDTIIHHWSKDDDFCSCGEREEGD